MRQSRSVDGSGFVGNIACTLHTEEQTENMKLSWLAGIEENTPQHTTQQAISSTA